MYIMKTLTVYLFLSLAVLLASCGENSESGKHSKVGDTTGVPAWLTGEDSIAYIENHTVKSPISVADLLGLAEVHTVEEYALNYENSYGDEEEYPEAGSVQVTPRDSAAMRLANRFMRMNYIVDMNGDANDKLQWALAVNAVLDTFRLSVPSVPYDSALFEIERVMTKFSSLSQMEMNFMSFIASSVDYYRTVEAYRQWLSDVPDELKTLAQEEYVAWHDLNVARFEFWRDVSYQQEWYSMKPMEIEIYYENLSSNRRAELELERGIILEGKPYRQKGKTVTAEQWEEWISEHSVPEDMEYLMEINSELIPSDSLVADHVNTLKSTFSRWLAARQAMASALPKERGISYNNLTADIYSRIIGKLEPIIIL